MSEERLKEIKEELAKISFSNIGHCVNTNLILDYITNLQEEIERLNNIINDYENTKNQLQQKDNIIKEVREYANNIMFETKAEEKIQDDILEILDKVD